MDKLFFQFERIVRRAHQYSETKSDHLILEHPFVMRNIHQSLPGIIKTLFDDGHYSQATFEAFKYIDKEVQRLSNSTKSGFKLMMNELNESNPSIRLTKNSTLSEKDEQKGFQFLFAGSILAIRNPRGHEYSFKDSRDQCLDHLTFASMLLRKIEDAGYNLIK